MKWLGWDSIFSDLTSAVALLAHSAPGTRGDTTAEMLVEGGPQELRGLQLSPGSSCQALSAVWGEGG